MAVPEGMVTVAEAAKILDRSIEQVRRYLREGKLKGQRIGQQWFIPKDALDSWKNGASLYERRMKLLREVQELREQIYKETGRLFDGPEAVRKSREERQEELEHRMP